VVRGQDEVSYVFELAGVPKDRISVELQGLTLRVSSNRPALSVDRSAQYVGSELLRSRTERTVQIPYPVEPSAVSAQFADGLLSVRVRMTSCDDKVHKIEVR
jgi:HSP20 family molecular chaperone IbpA